MREPVTRVHMATPTLTKQVIKTQLDLQQNMCIHGEVISWRSSKQKFVAKSTTEAEYNASSDAVDGRPMSIEEEGLASRVFWDAWLWLASGSVERLLAGV